MISLDNPDSFAPTIPKTVASHAIVLHSRQTPNRSGLINVDFTSLHEISDGSLAVGSVIDKQALVKLIESDTHKEISLDWIPEHALIDNATHLVWYRPQMQRPMRVKDSHEHHFLVKFPATLFIYQKRYGANGIFLFALESDCRPTLNTQLYQLPIGNVSSNGKLSSGSGSDFMPDNPTIENCDQIENCFFEALSTHTNTGKVLASEKDANKYGGNSFTEVIRFWRRKAKNNRRVNVKKELIPVCTVRDALRRTSC